MSELNTLNRRLLTELETALFEALDHYHHADLAEEAAGLSLSYEIESIYHELVNLRLGWRSPLSDKITETETVSKGLGVANA